jgi:predicted ATPase
MVARAQNVPAAMRVVMTGGPGAGKTTLLLALRARGYLVVDETARAVIQSRRAKGLPSRPPPLEFARTVLSRDIEQYQAYPSDALVFFDRGVLDALGLLCEAAPSRQAEVEALASRYPYHRQVFFLPPWEDIFTNDDERDQTFADAVRVHERLIAWYCRWGYQVLEVPRLSVEERCEYVLHALRINA